jgi:hypothetical protein
MNRTEKMETMGGTKRGPLQMSGASRFWPARFFRANLPSSARSV